MSNDCKNSIVNLFKGIIKYIYSYIHNMYENVRYYMQMLYI